MKQTNFVRLLLLASGLALAGCSSACDDGGKGQEVDSGLADAGADRDAIQSEEAGPADAGPDAWQLADSGPPYVDHDFCGQDKFFLKNPDGTVASVTALGQGWVLLGWWNREERHPITVRLYDLEQCREYALSPDWWKMEDYWEASIEPDSMVIDVAKVPDVHDRMDLYLVDLASWSVTQLTDTPDETEEGPAYNGRYVAYIKSHWDSEANTRRELGFWLMDTDTLESTMLAEPEAWVSFSFITERYVVWTAYTTDPQSEGRDVYYHDLQTGQTVQVLASREHYQYYADIWDHYIVWQETDDWDNPPYRLVLYDVNTGQKQTLTEEPGLYGFAVDKGIVVWSTYKYAPRPLEWKVMDIVAYDLRTSLERRLTTRAYRWGVGLDLSLIHI